MRITFTEGPERYETQGHGDIVRGLAREMDDDYAYGLIEQGLVKPADPASEKKYQELKSVRDPEPKQETKEEPPAPRIPRKVAEETEG